jgi:hypothetical protein
MLRTAISRFTLLAAILLAASPSTWPQASKKLESATKRMESPQQKMKHADQIMREQDRTSIGRGGVDKRAKPKTRPGLKRMVLPNKK